MRTVRVRTERKRHALSSRRACVNGGLPQADCVIQLSLYRLSAGQEAADAVLPAFERHYRPDAGTPDRTVRLPRTCPHQSGPLQRSPREATAPQAAGRLVA